MSIWQWVTLGLIVLAVVGMFAAWSAMAVSGQEDDREDGW
jgi:hypothetical protein